MANKKINQLVLKTTIQSTDLFPLGDPTTGQLFKKTVAELQAAIGGAVISVNGLVGTVVLDTDDIQELATPTNRYFTEARARAAISLTTTGNSGASTYSNSTGVLNVPTYTLAGLGGITASFLSGGTGITYNSGTGVISYSGTVYTDASIRALLSGANGISYNSSTGQFTYSGTVYTDSSIRALLSGTSPITYNSSTGAIGITQATTSTDGYLSSTDWNTFNGKQSALTFGNLTEATSSVLTITGGTGSVIGSGTSIQVKQASSTVSGFLSSTDWSTFNSKQGTITLTTTGTSGAATFSGGTLNIPQYQAVLTNPVTGTGTSGHVAYFNGSGSIAGSANHFWDNTNGRLGIGTTNPTAPLQIGSLTATSTTSPSLINLGGTYGTNFINGVKVKLYDDGTTAHGIGLISGQIYINASDGVTSISLNTLSTTRLSISPSGSTSLTGGTLSDPVLIVNGNTSATISGNAKRLAQFRYNTGDATGIDLGYDATAGNGVIAGGTSSAGAGIDFWTYNGTAWGNRVSITKLGNVLIGSSNTSGQGTGSPLYINLGDTFGTNTLGTNYKIRLFQPQDGTSIYGLGVSSGLFEISSAGSIGFFTNISSERGRITTGGNWLLGTTTDNGERLYVSGSIRATGSITANSDARLKKNIERIENALEKVGQISGYTYNTIYDEDRHAGVIAQEIDKVLPEIVNKGNDGLMGVEYGNISALLIEAIKDLKGQNESLKARLTALEK